jgi:NAD(P)H dehydrogenase (quinone)
MAFIARVFSLSILFCVLAFARQPGEKASADKARVLIAYHSVMGHTAALAKAVEEGAIKVPNVEVKRLPTSEVQCSDLFGADAVIVGSPVYWSNMSAEVKTFLDRWTHDCKVLPPAFEMKDKIGAAFVTAGEVSSGKEVTLLTIIAAMLGNRMIVVSDGEALGAAATTGEGKAPISEKDIDQGRRLGERVAQVAIQFKRGRQEARKQAPNSP